MERKNLLHGTQDFVAWNARICCIECKGLLHRTQEIIVWSARNYGMERKGLLHETQEFVAWNARICCMERKDLLHGTQEFVAWNARICCIECKVCIAIILFFVHKNRVVVVILFALLYHIFSCLWVSNPFFAVSLHYQLSQNINCFKRLWPT